MLKQYANVETAYGLKPEELQAKVSLCDALIVRSATKVGLLVPPQTPGTSVSLSNCSCLRLLLAALICVRQRGYSRHTCCLL